MATSEQREQESRWLARKAIRRAVMCLTRAAEADDTNGNPQGAVSYIAKAMNECKKAEQHFQLAITEKKKQKRGNQSTPGLSATEAKKQNATCISCHFFTPHENGETVGLCQLGWGTYCRLTLVSQEACGQYRKRGHE